MQSLRPGTVLGSEEGLREGGGCGCAWVGQGRFLSCFLVGVKYLA